MDESGRYGRVAGIFTISASNSTLSGTSWIGSFQDDIFLTGTAFWAPSYTYNTSPSRPPSGISISVSGNTLSWNVNRATVLGGTSNVLSIKLLYGVYS
jgi:hypothetical protein